MALADLVNISVVLVGWRRLLFCFCLQTFGIGIGSLLLYVRPAISLCSLMYFVLHQHVQI